MTARLAVLALLLVLSPPRPGGARAQDAQDQLRSCGAPGFSVEACTRVIALEAGLPGSLPEAFIGRGIALLRHGQPADALADFNEALRRDPNSARAYDQRGLARAAMGQYGWAIGDYDQSIAIDGRYGGVFDHRGQAHAARRDWARAIADYDDAIDRDPYADAFFDHRGEALAARGETDRAIADFATAIALNPNDALVFANRGLAYTRKRDFDRAIADLDRAIALDPRMAFAFDLRGFAYLNKHDVAHSIADYNEAIRLDPAYRNAIAGRQDAETAGRVLEQLRAILVIVFASLCLGVLFRFQRQRRMLALYEFHAAREREDAARLIALLGEIRDRLAASAMPPPP